MISCMRAWASLLMLSRVCLRRIHSSLRLCRPSQSLRLHSCCSISRSQLSISPIAPSSSVWLPSTFLRFQLPWPCNRGKFMVLQSLLGRLILKHCWELSIKLDNTHHTSDVILFYLKRFPRIHKFRILVFKYFITFNLTKEGNIFFKTTFLILKTLLFNILVIWYVNGFDRIWNLIQSGYNFYLHLPKGKLPPTPDCYWWIQNCPQLPGSLQIQSWISVTNVFI